MRYRVGNRVKIKSIDWYNKNKDKNGIVELSTHIFTSEMSEFCGKTVTIKDIFVDMDDNVMYYMEEMDFDWTDEMIEGLADELIEKTDDNQQNNLGIKMVSVDEVCNWLRNPLNFLQGGSEKLPDVIPIFNTIDEMVNDFLKITKK